MRITRLAAAGVVAAAAALALAAPARAEARPEITVDPERFRPGDNLTISVTACATRPRTGRPGLKNEIFAERPTFERTGPKWSAIAGTRAGLKPGRRYHTDFRCEVDGRTVTFRLTTSPSRTHEEPPKKPFAFGFDKVRLSTRTVTPKGEMTFTVTCPTRVSVASASFTEAPEFEKTEKGAFKGTGTFKATLPSIVKIKVICEDHGHVTYSTKPGDGDIGDGGPEIPKGAPDTGGGLAAPDGRGPAAPYGGVAYGGAALVLLAGAGGLAVRTLRRRHAAGPTDSV
ncbi:hypothetical protein [Thermomonospora umbrina]|uniref:Uncharacterized protein n=1 Tax=Thermomonospora umbrina TaxID=111806 RepID=A0A3D9SHW1_9ACTN|nr:hypothetical protein [Thermomonospora umbrina]REE95277.1 hypothetical protein DFJ69_0660 [Thermomonospora umbrina]